MGSAGPEQLKWDEEEGPHAAEETREFVRVAQEEYQQGGREAMPLRSPRWRFLGDTDQDFGSGRMNPRN
jgi:hypothetical protein